MYLGEEHRVSYLPELCPNNSEQPYRPEELSSEVSSCLAWEESFSVLHKRKGAEAPSVITKPRWRDDA